MQEEVLNRILAALKTNNPHQYTVEQQKKLVGDCLSTLEEGARSTLEKTPTKLAEFTGSMQRLQNSFAPNKIEDAVTNFIFVDKSKYTEEKSLFQNGELIDAFNKDNEPNFTLIKTDLANLGPTFSTAISTYTSPSDAEIDTQSLAKIIKHLTIGLITNQFTYYVTPIDQQMFNRQHGTINPNLAMAITHFAKENFDQLNSLTSQELYALGRNIKNSCNNHSIDCSPNKANNNLTQLLEAVTQYGKATLEQTLSSKNNATNLSFVERISAQAQRALGLNSRHK